jgi:hypothetical protein
MAGYAAPNRLFQKSHFDVGREYRAAGTREDNSSPNIGFMANYPLRVVKSEIRFVLWLFGFMRFSFIVIPCAVRHAVTRC